ncbi:MAG: class I SAM-dependent methyltransferase [Alphaproteobacteria bacterium]|nr:class I SAM-dependent methyltransferase [Alphaproteobacteria bacterium]
MRIFAFALAVALAMPAAGAPRHADVAAAVTAPGRPEAQVKLDASRKPVEMLRLLGLKPGDRALDLFGGSGYWSELMARAVGPEGRVTAWLASAETGPRTRAAWVALRARQANAAYFETPNDALALPEDAFDAAIVNLNYHDVYWESAKDGFRHTEPDAFLKTVYRALKPGGAILVIDHVGAAGEDPRVLADRLHRIDPAVVKADFARNGFVLAGESDALRNPADDHTKSVFDPAIRGKTDRIAYRFRKPVK